MSVGLAVRPMPSPTTKQVAATCQMELSGDSSTISAAPMMITTAPIRAVLRKPIWR